LTNFPPIVANRAPSEFGAMGTAQRGLDFNVAIELLVTNSYQQFSDAAETASKYLQNIAANPGDPKFRRIKCALQVSIAPPSSFQTEDAGCRTRRLRAILAMCAEDYVSLRPSVSVRCGLFEAIGFRSVLRPSVSVRCGAHERTDRANRSTGRRSILCAGR
jgi:hypothetical protein